MAATAGDFERLVELAHDRAGHSRRILVENVADLFITSEGRLSERERALMTDILGKLISEVESVVRRHLAERFSRLPSVPRELVVQLANDEIEVARPVLLASRVLQDADLIEIVKQRSQEHRLAVAMREPLSEVVADALVDYGEEDVIEALIANHDAVLSRQALDYLVEESQRLDRFQEPLLHRPDLPAQLAHRMFWWVSASLRRHILSEYEIDEGLVDSVIQDATRVAVRTPVAAMSETEELADRLALKGEITERFMVRTLRAGRVSLFVACLARLLGLDLRSAQRLVFDIDGAALAVAWRACDFGRESFATIYLVTRQAHDEVRTTDPALLTEMLGLFDSTTLERARAAVRYWMRDSDYFEAVAALEEGAAGPGSAARAATRGGRQ